MRTPIKIIITILISIFLLVLFFLYRQIKISSIICSNQFGSCNTTLNSELSALLGKDIFQAKNDLEKILQNKVYIKNYSIYYKFPDKLEVNIIVRKPKYSIFNNENYLLIDDEGTVLSLSDSTVLPTIINAERFLNVGENISPKELFSLKIVYDVQSIYKIKRAVFKQNELEIELADSYKVIFPVEGDREVLVGSLVLILDSLKDSEFRSENMINVQIIDLRFKNPVLK